MTTATLDVTSPVHVFQPILQLDKKDYFTEGTMKILYHTHGTNILISSDFYDNRHCCLGNFYQAYKSGPK